MELAIVFEISELNSIVSWLIAREISISKLYLTLC